jgi:hypothetical protein
MPTKSIHKAEYQLFLELLLEMRTKAHPNQGSLAAQIHRPQSYISDVERGTRRLDLLQLREYCMACGQDLVPFVKKFEKAVAKGQA